MRSPSQCAMIGTGERVGKTVITGRVARVMALDRRIIVVAIGVGSRRSLR